MKIITIIREFKIAIDVYLFLKINKIKIEKIRSNKIGRASKLTDIKVNKNSIIIIVIFFIEIIKLLVVDFF
tara:strand:+ start:622 stop:834 length:213 start_codon:yes stop_codon:yes gene_type:complete